MVSGSETRFTCLQNLYFARFFVLLKLFLLSFFYGSLAFLINEFAHSLYILEMFNSNVVLIISNLHELIFIDIIWHYIIIVGPIQQDACTDLCWSINTLINVYRL